MSPDELHELSLEQAPSKEKKDHFKKNFFSNLTH